MQNFFAEYLCVEVARECVWHSLDYNTVGVGNSVDILNVCVRMYVVRTLLLWVRFLLIFGAYLVFSA